MKFKEGDSALYTDEEGTVHRVKILEAYPVTRCYIITPVINQDTGHTTVAVAEYYLKIDLLNYMVDRKSKK